MEHIKVKRQSSKSTSFDPDDEQKEVRRQAELKERRIRLVDDLHKLKTLYYEEYMDGLTDKIKKQRKDIKRQTEKLNKKLEVEKMKEQEVRHHLRRRKSRSSIHKDNSFLENLQKTTLHRICAIETKLLSEGQLKTIEERDRFWEGLITEHDQPSPDQLEHRSDESYSQKTAPSASNQSSSLYQEDCETEEEPMATLLGLIQEETEISSAATNRKHSGTVPLQRQKSTASSGLHTKHPKVVAFEERFKQVEFPRLSAFTLDLEQKKEDSAELRLRQEYNHRAKLRRHTSKQLNRMYEMSLSHQATAQRMLERNEDLSTALEGPSLSDVLYSAKDDRLKFKRNIEKSASPAQTDMNNNIEETSSDEGVLDRGGSRQMECLSTASDGDDSSDEDIASISHLPLSLNAIMENSPVIEAKPSGVFWYNYGKFLPSIGT